MTKIRSKKSEENVMKNIWTEQVEGATVKESEQEQGSLNRNMYKVREWERMIELAYRVSVLSRQKAVQCF